jgi:N-acyl-D-amino-acid deacylase
MEYDLLIKNARICDGSGAPIVHGAIAVEDGTIRAVGEISGAAKQEIDAAGLVVAPGFVDIHTHYDAQIAWDRLLTCSCWHGVTTVLMGNCGVGVAPCKPGQTDVLAWDLVNVEAVPYEVLMDGVPWSWESFPDYMRAVTQPQVALNTAFLVPLSALRFYVMGDAATERGANPAETERMVELLHESMQAGAFGFSASLLPQHIGYQGRALSSRLTSRAEMEAFAGVLRELGRGVVALAEISDRPVTFIAMLDVPGNEGECERSLAKVAPYRRKGLKIYPQTTPRSISQYYTLREPFLFGSLASWKPAFNRSCEEQMALYSSAEFRQAFREDMKVGAMLFKGQWDRLHVVAAQLPAHQGYLNQSIQDIAEQVGTDPLDTLLDLSIAENLELGFTMSLINTDPEVVERLITHPDVLLGLSDAGAHVDQHCDAGMPTYLLHEWVHKRAAMTLEEGVRRLTSEPAEFLGLSNKGRIAPGMDADLVLFDPTTIRPCKPEWVDDLPGGKRRLIERAEGIAYTIVNGKVLFADNVHQGGFPGQWQKSA